MLLDVCMVGFYLCGGLVLFGGSALFSIVGLVLGGFFFCMFLFFGNKVFFGLVVLLVYLGGMLLLFTYVACMLGVFKESRVFGLLMYVGFGGLLFLMDLDGIGVCFSMENGLVFLLYNNYLFFGVMGGVVLVLVLVLILKFSLEGSLS
uniref:NADH dehydrogenase subunit 6 n=1 Tax=Halocynthia hilgendorfi ssp. n. KRK-2020 TaxID=2769794 RepID=A0A7G9XFL9_9ASCI|nr:NADH dehydrogenase subunit 6 [Halocynthia hilgendorfi ssp. n. KRK-2020]